MTPSLPEPRKLCCPYFLPVTYSVESVQSSCAISFQCAKISDKIKVRKALGKRLHFSWPWHCTPCSDGAKMECTLVGGDSDGAKMECTLVGGDSDGAL